MQYSPKLKIAMEEIKTILKKHDIAGFVVIHTPGFSEYLNHIYPSYSCAKLELDGFRFELKAADVGGKEKAKQIATDTLNMLTHIAETGGKNLLTYMDAEKLLKEKWGGYDIGGEHSSHDQQNN